MIRSTCFGLIVEKCTHFDEKTYKYFMSVVENHSSIEFRCDLSNGFNVNDLYSYDNIKCIAFRDGTNFNKNIDNLPKKLEILIMNDDFNQKIDHLPPNLYRLHLGKHFNQPVVFLPNNLLTVYFGSDFNRSIDNLPPNLDKLHLSHNFNKRVDHLPKKLITLILDEDFDQPIDNLPDSIESLILLSDCFSYKITKFPKNLKIFSIYKDYNMHISNVSPNTVIEYRCK